MLDALATAIDRLIIFVTEHCGDRPRADLHELLALDQEVAALCQVTGLTLPAITLEGYYAKDSIGFCQIPISQYTCSIRIWLDHGWVIAMRGLQKVAELKRARKRHGAPPKRGSRAAKIEALTQAMADHLRAARDYAFSTKEQKGTPELLPRPLKKDLAKQTGMSPPDVSRCLKDASARELCLYWDTALDLDQIMQWQGKRRPKKLQ